MKIVVLCTALLVCGVTSVEGSYVLIATCLLIIMCMCVVYTSVIEGSGGKYHVYSQSSTQHVLHITFPRIIHHITLYNAVHVN